jgi:CheY-like chemotaxis protein
MPAETATPASSPSPFRILLIEDEPLILMSTADMHETMGHTVLEAMTAEEALSIFEREPVDVLMTDHGLPAMSGADLAVACQRLQSGIGIVFASGAVNIPRFEGHDLIADATFLPSPMKAS